MWVNGQVPGEETPGSPEFEQTRTFLQHNLHQLNLVLRDMTTSLSVRDRRGLTAPESVALRALVEQVVQNLQNVLAECQGTAALPIPAALRVFAAPVTRFVLKLSGRWGELSLR